MFSSKQLLDQDLFRSASWEEKLVMDSITYLPSNLIYRNVLIPLWPQKKIKWPKTASSLTPSRLFLPEPWSKSHLSRLPTGLHSSSVQTVEAAFSLSSGVWSHSLYPGAISHMQARTSTHMHSHILFLEPHAAKVSLLRAFKFLRSFVLPLFCVEYLRMQESQGWKKSEKIPALIQRL